MTFLIFVLLLHLPAESMSSPTGSFDDYLNEFSRYSESNSDSALYYARKMLEAATSDNNLFNIVRAEYALGYTYRQRNEYDVAIAHYRRSLELSNSGKFPEREIMASNGLGMALYEAGNFPDALRYLYMSLRLREKNSKPEEMALIYNNIGVVYLKLWNWEKALDYFRLSQKFQVPTQDPVLILNMATCLMYMENYQDALEQLNEFRMICGTDCPPSLLCDFHNVMGGIYLNQGNADTAIVHFSKVLPIAGDQGLLLYKEIAYDNLASAELSLGNISQARNYAGESMEMAHALGLNQRIQSNYKLMAQIQSRLGNPDSAVSYWVKHDSVRAITLGEDALSDIYKYELAWVENSFAHEIAAQQELLASSKRTNIIFISMSAIAGFFALMWGYNLHKKRRAYAKLDKAKHHLVRQEKMAALGSLMAGIAHELNNPLGSALASARSGISRHKELLATRDEDEISAAVAQDNELAQMALTGMERRRIRSNLRSQLLGKENLAHIPADEIFLDLGVHSINAEWEQLLSSPMAADKLQKIYSEVMLSRDLGRIERSLNGMKEVILALKFNSRVQQGKEVREMDICANIQGVLVLLHNQLKYGVDVLCEFPQNGINIIGDPQQLSQVWTNLLMNSIQALPEQQGNIQIKIARLYAGYLKIEFHDSGRGVSGEHQENVFEEHYTSRKESGGSGLGLHISRNIIINHGGRISFYSTSESTIFTVFLPHS